jgi:hypothetical protein
MGHAHREIRGTMTREARWLVLLCIGGVGCARGCACDGDPGQAAPAPESAPGTVAAGAPENPLVTPLGRTPRNVLVAGKTGILEVAAGGEVVRTFNPAPGSEPRLLGHRELVFLRVRHIAGQPAFDVWRLSLETGEERMVAHVPPFVCHGDGEAPSADSVPDVAGPMVDLQSSDDFRVCARDETAVLELMDRDPEAATLEVSTRVHLRTGEVERRLVRGADGCNPGHGVTVGDAFVPCAPEPHAPEARPAGYPFHVEDENLVRRVGEVPQMVARLESFAEVSTSPTGRWALLAGAVHREDEITRALLVLDRRDGQIYPAKAGDWPPALDAHELERPGHHTVRVDEETDVRWLDFGTEEALLVGHDVLVPGKRSWKVPGDVAR